MKYLIILLSIWLYICGTLTISDAADATLQQVINTVEQGYGALKDLKAGFSQTTVLAGFPKPQKGEGELALRRTGQGAAQFRFDYTNPKQSIISNGKQVWFYQPENRQVIISPLEKMLQGGNSIGMAYLTGLGNLSRDFTASFGKPVRDKQGNYLLELTPIKPTPLLVKLYLTVQGGAVSSMLAESRATVPFPLVASVIRDASGTETRFNYSNIRTNSGLPADRFTFKVPQGVEVIKP